MNKRQINWCLEPCSLLGQSDEISAESRMLWMDLQIKNVVREIDVYWKNGGSYTKPWGTPVDTWWEMCPRHDLLEQRSITNSGVFTSCQRVLCCEWERLLTSLSSDAIYLQSCRSLQSFTSCCGWAGGAREEKVMCMEAPLCGPGGPRSGFFVWLNWWGLPLKQGQTTCGYCSNKCTVVTSKKNKKHLKLWSSFCFVGVQPTRWHQPIPCSLWPTYLHLWCIFELFTYLACAQVDSRCCEAPPPLPFDLTFKKSIWVNFFKSFFSKIFKQKCVIYFK